MHKRNQNGDYHRLHKALTKLHKTIKYCVVLTAWGPESTKMTQNANVRPSSYLLQTTN